MSKNLMIAAVATVGMLSSTLALAEVSEDSVIDPKALMAPAVVVESVAAPAAVESGTQNSMDPSAESAPHAAAIIDDPDTLAELVDESDVGELTADEKCLATAVYYEARSESLAGQLAVAHVVLQRAKSGRFPSSLCGVVTQPGQFSFVRGGRMPTTPTHAGQWRTARAIAQIALDGSWENPVEGALYFHAARVQPGWGRPRVTRIGGHVFYR
jgi:N-acetylmuramoyl-L-alanine amidase